MNARVCGAFVVLTIACSADTFTTKDGGVDVRARLDIDAADASANDAAANDAADDTDPPADAAGDARLDAHDSGADAIGDGCSSIWGATGCGGIMNAFCTALVNKCGAWPSVMQCTTWWASNWPADYDCTANKFKKSVCGYEPNQCANVEIPSYFCGKLQSNTPGQLGGACGSFFAEFP